MGLLWNLTKRKIRRNPGKALAFTAAATIATMYVMTSDANYISNVRGAVGNVGQTIIEPAANFIGYERNQVPISVDRVTQKAYNPVEIIQGEVTIPETKVNTYSTEGGKPLVTNQRKDGVIELNPFTVEFDPSGKGGNLEYRIKPQ